MLPTVLNGQRVGRSKHIAGEYLVTTDPAGHVTLELLHLSHYFPHCGSSQTLQVSGSPGVQNVSCCSLT